MPQEVTKYEKNLAFIDNQEILYDAGFVFWQFARAVSCTFSRLPYSLQPKCGADDTLCKTTYFLVINSTPILLAVISEAVASYFIFL
jgi:hypothetical protein